MKSGVGMTTEIKSTQCFYWLFQIWNSGGPKQGFISQISLISMWISLFSDLLELTKTLSPLGQFESFLH